MMEIRGSRRPSYGLGKGGGAMKTRRGWRWFVGAGGRLVARTMVAPGGAWAATVEAQQGRPARIRQVEPPALQARPAPDTGSWGRDRDEGRDRDWHDGHRDRDGGHAWG